jgi:phosphoenolpyruvate carboxykinase (GTP)
MTVDADIWREEASLIPGFYDRFGDRMPPALWAQYEALLARLGVPAGADRSVELA